VLTGKTQMKPIEERAVNEITQMTIGEGLGKLFVDQYYSEKSQIRVNTMVDNLLLTFEERIKALPWMSAETKKEALNKLKSIGRKLGFPSKWENFGDLKLSKTDYVANIKLCSLRDVKKNFEELSQAVDKAKWGMPAHMINAYYHPLLNESAFPAGIMQAPFFDVNAEDAVNYGRIGMVIGHEFTHGFDDQGAKFDGDGNRNDWWTPEDFKKFTEKGNALANQYSSYEPIQGLHINGAMTLGENIVKRGILHEFNALDIKP
jgi:putative endopeptidase